MATKQNYSGRKSAVVVELDAKISTGASYPSDSVTEETGKVTVFTASSEISASSGKPALASGESAFYRNGSWFKIEPATGEDQFAFLIADSGATTGKIAFIIPSANSIDLSNGTEIESWESFGTIYRDKMPTIMDWNGSIKAKVDFGDNPAQILLYKSLLQQQKVVLYSYLYFATNSSHAIDTTKAVRQYGDAYIKSFNITASPTTVADLTLDYEGDGELKMDIGSEKIVTNWSDLN